MCPQLAHKCTPNYEPPKNQPKEKPERMNRSGMIYMQSV